MSDIPSQGPVSPIEGPSPVQSPPPAASEQPRLRLWPGLVIIAVEWLVLIVPGWLAPGTFAQFFCIFLGPMLAALALGMWWVFAGRVRGRDRWLAPLTCLALAGALASPVAEAPPGHPLRDPSIGPMVLFIYALPIVTTAAVVWLAATPFLRLRARANGLLVVFALAWGCFTLVRFEGVYGDFTGVFRLRMTPTAEEIHQTEVAARQPAAVPALDGATAILGPGDWPGFRGPNRDGVLSGVRIATDWQQHPPRLVWQHRVGPGWSSFAVIGQRLFTQEQWGEKEVVICYDRDSGKEVWRHEDKARFVELVGGPGPRATPTFHEGRIYAMGATGILNCLNAATGELIWSRNIVNDSGSEVPTWGFAASPLVHGGLVTVFGGAPGKCVLAYHAASGEPAWSAGDGKLSYCSTQLARLDGVEQLLINTGSGVTSLHPTRGDVLWQYDWDPGNNMARVVQPAVVGNDVVIGSAVGAGTRRVHLARDGNRWTTRDLWTSRAISPYYNDFVIHGDHLYGFDSQIFTCVRLQDGKKKWRARGYGNGQVLLLKDQELLLVLAEQGEVALVEAVADGHKEIDRFQAIDGKTWNHPVVAHGKLFVRNGEKAACYELRPASSVARR